MQIRLPQIQTKDRPELNTGQFLVLASLALSLCSQGCANFDKHSGSKPEPTATGKQQLKHSVEHYRALDAVIAMGNSDRTNQIHSRSRQVVEALDKSFNGFVLSKEQVHLAAANNKGLIVLAWNPAKINNPGSGFQSVGGLETFFAETYSDTLQHIPGACIWTIGRGAVMEIIFSPENPNAFPIHPDPTNPSEIASITFTKVGRVWSNFVHPDQFVYHENTGLYTGPGEPPPSIVMSRRRDGTDNTPTASAEFLIPR